MSIAYINHTIAQLEKLHTHAKQALDRADAREIRERSSYYAAKSLGGASEIAKHEIRWNDAGRASELALDRVLMLKCAKLRIW